MTINVGDKLPEAKFRVMTAEGPQVKTTDDIFKGKKVALFAVPGAYTGTCHKMHLPSIFGMELDASANGLGIRSKRYSMLVEDGVVKKLNLEPAPGKVEVSGGDTLLGQL